MSLIEELLYKLSLLEDKLYMLKMKRTKHVSLTITEIQERMRNHEYIPTNIFNTTKTDYIVKDRSIHGPNGIKIKKR